jgi:hypothetical protein
MQYGSHKNRRGRARRRARIRMRAAAAGAMMRNDGEMIEAADSLAPFASSVRSSYPTVFWKDLIIWSR